MRKLRVLIIDDSAYNRQTIAQILESCGDIEIVGKAFDGEEGLKLAMQEKPDLVTLDLEMPRMDGFTFLRLLMAKKPLPVVVISQYSQKQAVFQALELGALDFIAKPARFIQPDVDTLRQEIIEKVQLVRAVHRLPPPPYRSAVHDGADTHTHPSPPRPTTAGVVQRVICIGASTGGPKALQTLLKGLRPTGNLAILIAQHMPAKFTQAFAERLDRMVDFKVCEAQDGDTLKPDHVYIAPGGAHMELVKPNGTTTIRITAHTDIDRYTPSIDRLIGSATILFGKHLLAVILTGMGFDGCEAVKAARQAGSPTIAESEASAVIFGMPKAAIDTGCVDHIVDLDAMGAMLQSFAETPT